MEISKKINKADIIAVLIVDELRHALPLAEALLKGGVTAIELTFGLTTQRYIFPHDSRARNFQLLLPTAARTAKRHGTEGD